MKTQHSTKIQNGMKTIYETITGLTDEYSASKLDDEYRDLIQYAVAALARKRPSPLLRGKPKIWACAAIHAIGMANFLFDKSFKPYVASSELADDFNLSQSTISNKSRQIRDMLKMYQLDPHWMVPSKQKESPMSWLISVNDGMIVDARTLPIEIQKEAYELGLIPGID